MIYLVVSIISAFAIALPVYAETSSFWIAFAAYSLTGTLVLSLILVAAFFNMRNDEANSENDEAKSDAEQLA